MTHECESVRKPALLCIILYVCLCQILAIATTTKKTDSRKTCFETYFSFMCRTFFEEQNVKKEEIRAGRKETSGKHQVEYDTQPSLHPIWIFNSFGNIKN